MPLQDDRENSLRAIRSKLSLPSGISIGAWTEANFLAIRKLSSAEGWTTPQQRPDEALVSWRHSWPALVATDGTRVVGFVRALTDGEVTTYVAELLVDPQYRGQGIGIALLDACHYLCPHTRLDLLSTESSDAFYEANGFRRFQGFRKSYR